MKTKNDSDSRYLWMEGKIVPYEEATVHVLSHTLHYGTGIFEGMRAYETGDGRTAIFKAMEHYFRFLESIKILGTTRYSLSELVEATRELIKVSGLRECYVRPFAYLDDSIKGLQLPVSPTFSLAIAAWSWGKYLGDEGQKNGIRVRVSSFRRGEASTHLSNAKISGYYVTSVLARREATAVQFDESILLDRAGFVAEGSGENIFIVKDGVIKTPSLGSILPGITRKVIMELARDVGHSVIESTITRNELYLADEAFFTGTAVEVTPIREIDHYPIGNGKPGSVTTKLKDLFFRVVRGELPKYKEWLTYVSN